MPREPHDPDQPHPAPPAGEEAEAFVRELVANTRQIYVFIATMIAAPEEVEDVYQQTCVALWNKRHVYEPGRSFYSWACGFARNEALRHLRSRRSAKVRLSEKSIELIAAEQAADSPRHVDLRRAALDDCLDELSARQRGLLERCYAGDETIRSIATELGISAAALTMRLQRIRHVLAACIEQTISHTGAG